jgi:hypothetical protein
MKDRIRNERPRVVSDHEDDTASLAQSSQRSAAPAPVTFTAGSALAHGALGAYSSFFCTMTFLEPMIQRGTPAVPAMAPVIVVKHLLRGDDGGQHPRAPAPRHHPVRRLRLTHWVAPRALERGSCVEAVG